MSKYRNTITLILSAISIMVSVAALCRTYPHTSDLGMDYQGVIVGILALLVTAVIGLNIYTLVDFKRATKEVEALKRKLHTDSNTNLALGFNSAFMIYHYLFTGKTPLGLDYELIRSGLLCLKYLSETDNIEACNAIVKNIKLSMQELKTIEITKQQKEELVSLILDIKNHRLIDGFQDVVHLVSCIVPEVRHPLPCGVS